MGCGGSKSEDQIIPIIQEPTLVEEFTQNESEENKSEENKSDVLDEAMKVIDDIKQSFNEMDLDANGYLSKEELKQGYSNGEFEISDVGIDYIMKNVDTDEDGNVNKG